MARRGRPKNPNSQRSLLEKKKKAEQLALEAEAKAEQLAAVLAEKERLLAEKEAKLAEAQERAEREAAEREAKLAEEWKQIQERLEAEAKEQEDDPIEEMEVINPEEKKEAADADFLLGMLNDNLTKEKHPEQANNESELTKMINDEDGDFADDFDEPEPVPEIIKETPDGLEYRIPAGETADMVITGIDVLLKYIGPYTYKKAMFSKDEIKRMTILSQQAKLKPKSEMVYEDSDYEIVQKLDDFLEYKEEIVPLNAEEIKMLKAPLKAIFKDKGGQISPTAGLMYAATMIALPRFAPQGGEMLQKLFSKLLNITDESESETES